MLSKTEENYIKALLCLTSQEGVNGKTGTNSLASHLALRPATVSDMLKRLKEKDLINYEKYGKISLTEKGRKVAIKIIRKHRLWETFLYEKLGFSWDEIHDLAEQLEHIQSDKLVKKLDEFLNFPEYDPHGDPIPKPNGKIPKISTILLSEIKVGEGCEIVAVKDTSVVFLQYLQKLTIGIGTQIKVIEKIDYDGSMILQYDDQKKCVSKKLANNILVSI